jgi:hypothetical protein
MGGLVGEMTAQKDEIHFQVRRRRKKGEKGEERIGEVQFNFRGRERDEKKG